MKKVTLLVLVVMIAVIGFAFDTSRSVSGEKRVVNGMNSRPDDQKTRSPEASTTLVISQAYGGGGGSTGTYLHDYVELKNIADTPQALDGLQLMYGSATGQFGSSAGNIFALPNAVLNPGQYFLIQLSGAGSAGAALPVTPDATTTNLSMSASNGKVALVTSAFTGDTCGSTATPCSIPNVNIIDLVAWGTANNAEGGAATNGGASLTSTQGNVRKESGCQDTDNNNSDFDVVTAPVPRNSATTPAPCGESNQAPRFFTASLLGENESPPNGSFGSGYGTVRLNEAEDEITVNVNWLNLSSNTTAAHIHGTAMPGQNAGVIFDLMPEFETSGSASNRTFAVTAQQVSDLRNGLWYFNVHSQNFGDGEIRGQIMPVNTDAPLDFNGDGKTDYSVLRVGNQPNPNHILWYTRFNGTMNGGFIVDWGLDTDLTTPGDFDGDGADDVAVWRQETGNSGFYILHSSDFTIDFKRFGQPGDIPIVSDYDGDGADDPAIYRKGAGPNDQSYFWWLGSAEPFRNVEIPVAWGNGGDFPYPGDFNGDGKADFCVYRNLGGQAQFIYHPNNGGFDAPGDDVYAGFGLFSDNFMPGDYDGDGITDFAVTRYVGGAIVWYILPSGGGPMQVFNWGLSAFDFEVPGDYDGDGKTDIAVWRASNPATFYVLKSSGGVEYFSWGSPFDIPTGYNVF